VGCLVSIHDSSLVVVSDVRTRTCYCRVDVFRGHECAQC